MSDDRNEPEPSPAGPGKAPAMGMDAADSDDRVPIPYGEDFKESLGFRQEQHRETAAYLERLTEESRDRVNAYFTPDSSDTEAWKESIGPYRDRFRAMIGYPPPEPNVPAEPASGAPERSGKKDSGADFKKIYGNGTLEIYRAYLTIANGIRVYGIYMVPAAPGFGRRPLVVALHGGGGCPEAICGIGHRANYHDFGYRAVMNGYAVWAPYILMRVGYAGDPDIRPDRWELDRTARILGTSIVGIETFRIVSSTNLLLEARGELDPSRIAIAGLSYGGYYALYAAAASDVFAATVCSGFYRSFADAWKTVRAEDDDRRHQSLLTTFDLPVTASLACPRPLMIQHGTKDGVIPAEDARNAVPFVRSWYERLGIPDKFTYDEHSGAHEFEPDAIFGFLDKHV